MSEKKGRPSYLLSVLENKCPRCRKGHLFLSKNAYGLKNSRYIKINAKCPVCGQPTDIEVGFYYGTGYISYALAFVLSVATFIAWWVFIGFSVKDNDNRVFWWIGSNIVALLVLQPYLMRLSRSLWLSFFVGYNPNWEFEKAEEPERIVSEQMNNW